jgi:hypothetical protein
MKKMIIIILVLIIIYLLWNNSKKEQFTVNKDIYNRNYTELLCDDKSDIYNGVCYIKCKPGYETQDNVCVKKCLGDLKETKTHCLKNKPKFLGKEYDSLEECISENKNGCFKEGLKFYGLCPKEKKQVGQFCEDKCLGNMQDDGFGCTRTIYFREVGNTKPNEVCPKGADRIGDRCYEKCKEGYIKNGIFCIKNKIL